MAITSYQRSKVEANGRGENFFTGRTMATSRRYDTTSGKITFLKQDAHSLDVWQEPFVELRAPLIANLRSDPFERVDYEGIDYGRWYIDHAFVFAPAATYIGQWLQSFREFPPSQKPGAFNLNRVMEVVIAGAITGNN